MEGDSKEDAKDFGSIYPNNIKIVGGGGEVVVPPIEVDKDFSANSISSYFIDSVK